MPKQVQPSPMTAARAALSSADATFEASQAACQAAQESLALANGVYEATSPEDPAERRRARIERDDAAELVEYRERQLGNAKATVAECEAAVQDLIRHAWNDRRDAARKALEDAILALAPEFWRSSLQCGHGFGNLSYLLADVARCMESHPTASEDTVTELMLRLPKAG